MSTNSVAGTNVPPISFPGIVSGIDYNSIINQLTSLSLQPAVGLNAAVTTLNNANVELVNINNLIASVQNSLGVLSNPDLFDTYDGTSTNTSALTATGTPGIAANPGAYTITKVQTATATSVLSCTFAGYGIEDDLTSGPYAGQPSSTAPLADSYASVTPSNGSGSLGQVTIDGVQLSYNVNTQSLNQIISAINTAVQSVDSGFSATVTNGVVSFTSSDQPISLGSSSDQGNLLDVLKLSDAQLNNTSNSGSIVGTGNVGGISEDASFDSTTAAGFKTAVTGGFFTINGVKITVSTGDNVSDVLTAINSSDAGVVATYNQDSGQITLTASTAGPQGIVLGATGDTSNFLSAAGLKASSGATTDVGTQSEVDLQTAGGGTQKFFSNTNAVTSAISGITLNLQSSTTTPFVVTVAQNTTQLVSAFQGFVSAYNAAVSEINIATAPPVVSTAAPGSGGQAQSYGGGVLFGNTEAQTIVQQLTQITSGFLGSGSSYNSLSQIGLQLSNTFSTLTSGNNSDSQGNTGGTASSSSSGEPIQSTTFLGTDGTLQALDVSQFLSALQSDPSAVNNLINGATGLTTQLGSYLTTVTGTPTLLNSGIVGNIPTISILQNFENTNTDAISSYQQQISQIQDSANTQANTLRAEFVASESLIAGLQSEQQELAAALGFTVSSSSSSTAGTS